MSLKDVPQSPFGAVYFRKSNPPSEDWERDYNVAAQDGLNVFRHWFLWSAIERKPGEYDWEEFDRQLDLAAQNGIKTIIAEITHSAPDWAIRKFPDARQLCGDGTPLPSIMGHSSATGGSANNGGGAGPLTLNSPEVKEAAGNFLKAMATRYKGHKGLLGYDVWNECNYSPLVDYSEYSKSSFREWLQAKYGDLEAVCQAWYRYGLADWLDIEPPVEIGPYPESLDWVTFKRDNFYEQMQWRIDLIREIDPDCLIAAHGVAGAITNMIAGGCDDWLAASKVELYGMTWIPGRKGNQPWRNFFGADLTRAASRGKPFWHAERQGGPLWMQPQVLGRDKDDGRVAEPDDIKVWTMSSFAAGATGVLNLRYRPLLDGSLFGAFGSYGMDGSRTSRSEMASKLGKWANAREQAKVFEARPRQGDVGILVIPEAQAWDYLLNHKHQPTTYSDAMFGAYRGFFDNGIQADWVHIDDIDKYDAIYAPYPIAITSENAARLAHWVKSGGKLISEACPGYFGDRGKVGTVQPNNGLDSIFGARETDVEFMPDIGDRVSFDLEGQTVTGGGFLQSYELAGGTERARFSDGRIAIVEHGAGSGQALLVGSNPSITYFRTSNAANREYFATVFAWLGKTPHVALSNNQLQARLHDDAEGSNLWMINHTRETQTSSVAIDGIPAIDFGEPNWADKGTKLEGGIVTLPPRGVLLVRCP